MTIKETVFGAMIVASLVTLTCPAQSLTGPAEQPNQQYLPPLSSLSGVPAAIEPDYYRAPMDLPIHLSANYGEIRTNRFHTGVDIKTGGETGKQLRAAADGYISRVSVAPSGYGRTLYIAHPNGTTTLYAHMERFRPDIEEWLRTERYRQKVNDIDAFPTASRFPVKQGDPIGLSGNSGASRGPHLHFEVRESTSSRTLNVLARGWIVPAMKDHTPPRIVRIYHVDVDTVAGVPVHSRPRAHEVKRNPDGTLSLAGAQTLKAGPVSYFVVETTDRRDGEANIFGVYRARMTLDGDETVVFEKDALLFDHNRYACASVLWERQKGVRNEVIMLARREGNALPMYKKALGGGAITVAEGERCIVRVSVEDDSGNTSTVAFAVEPNPHHTAPEQPEGVVASSFANFSFSSEGLAVAIPAGALHESIFYTQRVVGNGIKPRSDSIHPLSPLYKTGDGMLPLHRAMTISIAADVPEKSRYGACLAKVLHDGSLSYAGGQWSGGSAAGSATGSDKGSVTGSPRDFGTFCVVADTRPPAVGASFASGADLGGVSTISFTASDNFSGIASFEGTIDGRWVAFERNAGRSRFTHRFESKSQSPRVTHTYEFTVRDGAGNTTRRKGTFKR